ncbi:hypothetical protein NA57DRAFT_42926 [Rhizodiscina lignyota]|uniref:Btz domain-containing protein n=1 Tax=Rhizodiscina lignyota TaxID=1504668 RepID=A0A9P4IB34_9PEZI|nr:hypothetical protein NA57DRAFT_42926 [Rhizodiscina lignyota]
MPGQRHRNLVRSRRRVEDEGEEEGVLATEVAEDSQSEASVPTDHDADGDADDSDLSESDIPEASASKSLHRVNGVENFRRSKGQEQVKPTEPTPDAATNETSFTPLKDTEAMMNGLNINKEAGKEEAVDFETLAQPVVSDNAAQAESQAQNKHETLAEKRRREHEEYKQKRDADPAFIPNRGAFFMHDQRSAGHGQNGVRPLGRGRGRGRGAVGGPFSPANLMAQAAEATNNPWKHDLHETLNEDASKPSHQPAGQGPAPRVIPPAHSAIAPGVKDVPPNRTFSSTRTIGKIQIRLSLPGMKAPITFSEVPVRQYTRLPNHRPPLRRDKPVRISLPDCPVRYIFPSTDRSFIFIPRAQRPNQQAFGRGRGRAFGSIGGFSSRRTSAYGGSIYSPSVGMSRRSSLAGQYGREGLISPTGSALGRAPGGFEAARPVVRLPPGSQQHTAHGTPIHSATMSGAGTPVVGMPPPQSYPLPQKPTFRENWSGPIPMHQPRPQKNVSVSGIESPESLQYHAPQQQEQQPFHQQVPAHMNRGTSPEQYPHSRQPSFPGQPTVGTPLSNIPERAIHAQPFQPYQQGFPQGYPAQPAYFYPPQNGAPPQYSGPMPGGAVIAPMFVPNGQNGAYIVPAVAAPVPAPAPQNPTTAGQGNMVAHETNGMVYYYDPSQLYQAPVEGYAGPSYAMPGMGGMMTPTPDGFYYPQVPQGTVYYQPQ